MGKASERSLASASTHSMEFEHKIMQMAHGAICFALIHWACRPNACHLGLSPISKRGRGGLWCPKATNDKKARKERQILRSARSLLSFGSTQVLACSRKPHTFAQLAWPSSLAHEADFRRSSSQIAAVPYKCSTRCIPKPELRCSITVELPRSISFTHKPFASFRDPHCFLTRDARRTRPRIFLHKALGAAGLNWNGLQSTGKLGVADIARAEARSTKKSEVLWGRSPGQHASEGGQVKVPMRKHWHTGGVFGDCPRLASYKVLAKQRDKVGAHNLQKIQIQWFPNLPSKLK